MHHNVSLKKFLFQPFFFWGGGRHLLSSHKIKAGGCMLALIPDPLLQNLLYQRGTQHSQPSSQDQQRSASSPTSAPISKTQLALDRPDYPDYWDVCLNTFSLHCSSALLLPMIATVLVQWPIQVLDFPCCITRTIPVHTTLSLPTYRFHLETMKQAMWENRDSE